VTPARAAALVAAQEDMFAQWRRADVTVTNDGSPDDLARAADRLWLNYGPGRRPEPKD
jgi:dephospho-CoA kinase